MQKSMTEHHHHVIPKLFYRISIKGLVLDSQKRFLLLKEEHGRWDLPGGGLEPGETPEECLKREITEEMGLEVTEMDSRPVYFLTAKHPTKDVWMANVIYRVTLNNLNFTPSDECVEVRFFTPEDAQKEVLVPNVVEFVKLFDPAKH